MCFLTSSQLWLLIWLRVAPVGVPSSLALGLVSCSDLARVEAGTEQPGWA